MEAEAPGFVVQLTWGYADMGFSVPQFELGKEHREQPGQDFVPPERGYKPTINLHGNHSNLDHDYDPRHDLPYTFPIDDPEEVDTPRHSYAVPITLLLLSLLIGALIALPLLIR